MKIVFASHNQGKLQELGTALSVLNIEIIPQSLHDVMAIDETGLTFVENAILKARHASLQTGLPAIADDSGLQVDVLDGAPGIYSARYAGERATATDNMTMLLDNLAIYSDDQRKANFYCALVFIRHPNDPTPIICEGIWHGIILKAPQGHDGFGYDPIFFDVQENRSAAQLSMTQKNRISHRGQALRYLVDKLTGLFNNKKLCMHSLSKT